MCCSTGGFNKSEHWFQYKVLFIEIRQINFYIFYKYIKNIYLKIIQTKSGRASLYTSGSNTSARWSSSGVEDLYLAQFNTTYMNIVADHAVFRVSV